MLRTIINALFQLGSDRNASDTRPYRTSGSGTVGAFGSVGDDVADRMARLQLAYQIRALNAAERVHERGWDWDPTVPDALFYGQTTTGGPADTHARVAAAEHGLARAADLYAGLDWSPTLA